MWFAGCGSVGLEVEAVNTAILVVEGGGKTLEREEGELKGRVNIFQ